jgi:hypothetical protein
VVAPEQDAVEFGARPVPRWAIAAAGTLAAVAFMAASSQPKASRRPTPPRPAAIAGVVTTGRLGTVVQLGAEALDALVRRNKLHVLCSAAVTVVDLAAKRVDRTSLPGGRLPRTRRRSG